MKKSIKRFCFLFFAIVIWGYFYTVISYAESITLSQIASEFNNCSTVKQYEAMGVEWKANASDNKLTITMPAADGSLNFEYVLEENILSAEFSEANSLAGVLVTNVLVDSIGKLHGYSDGDLLPTLSSDEIVKYTVKNEGFEIKKLSSGSSKVMIDINKKIPLMNFSNVYLEVSDLQDLKNYIAGDGVAEKSKGNVWFNKNGYNGKNTVLVAEKGKLTNNAYQSILSIVEVMFDSKKAVNYFEKNYASIAENKEFEGIKIEINPTKTEFEESVIPEESGREFIRLTIDKNVVTKAMNGNLENTENNQNKVPSNNTINNNNTNNVDKQPTNNISNKNNQIATNQNTSITELPKAGNGSKMIVFMIIIICIIGAIIFIIKWKNIDI